MGRARPVRGEIWIVDLGIAQKRRPVVILSVDPIGDERVVATYVARTTALRGTRFEVLHDAPHFKPGAFDVQSIGTVPTTWLERRIGQVSSELLTEIESKVREWLAL